MTLALTREGARAFVVEMMREECESLGLLWYGIYEEILLCRSKEIGIHGGVRASKSNIDALAIYFHPRFLGGGGLFWIVGHTYKAAEKEFTYLLGWVKAKGLLLTLNQPENNSWRMRLKNGTVVETRSGEHPERLESDAPHRILIVEAGKCKPGVRKNCRQRALENDAQVYSSGTLEEEEDDGAQRYIWFEGMADEAFIDVDGEGIESLNGDGRGRPNPDVTVFTLPSWTNEFIFPGGFENPKIQAEYQYYLARDQLYTFNRKYAGIRGEVQHAIYPLVQGNEARLVSPPAGLKFITLRGGSDYGTVHPSALVVGGLDVNVKMGAWDNKGRWSENRDLWIMDGWWDGGVTAKSGLRGDPEEIGRQKRILEGRFPGLTRWVTDPNERYMAKTWKGTAAPSGAGSREVRVGTVKGRQASMTIWYNRDSAFVRGLYAEMQQVRYKVTADGELVNARENDDRVAAHENLVWGLSTQPNQMARKLVLAPPVPAGKGAWHGV